MTTLRVYQPHHEPTGETFAVVVTLDGGVTVRVPCWTAEEAGQVRDDALDAGYRARILGLPFTGCAVGFPVRTGPLPEVRDE